ncbi:hypothetical protein GWI33_021000 [Rhynchophorus ferrugineus]|uniref:Uncharacterized protein n=1 Tax=Rhynchophorus ferrugineus TaxID=354439 RepID=A0A834M3M3_RHYFE|nr:hypothetical protein GWI33_021000 [Rhynchophorus ferrugineus]
MALAMVLRNSAKLKGFSSIPRCTFNVQKTQNFTQFRNPKTTSQSLQVVDYRKSSVFGIVGNCTSYFYMP